jgi:hypothetical protein
VSRPLTLIVALLLAKVHELASGVSQNEKKRPNMGSAAMAYSLI